MVLLETEAQVGGGGKSGILLRRGRGRGYISSDEDVRHNLTEDDEGARRYAIARSGADVLRAILTGSYES